MISDNVSQVLVYRDKSGPGDDRTSRLSDVIKFCQLSYRAGARFNPDEVTFKGARDKKSNKGKKKKSQEHDGDKSVELI